MLQTEHEQFEEPDYPAFPVVFQRQLQEQFEVTHQPDLSKAKKTITVPEHEASALLRLSTKKYETKYSHLFTEKIANQKPIIQNFLRLYTPIDESLVEQLQKNIQDVVMLRLGSNKIYVGNWNAEGNKCHGKGIVIFKNGNLYEGEMSNNKRHGKGIYIQSNLGWFKGNFRDDLKTGSGIQSFYQKGAYQGEFMNGLRHGQGLYADKDGNVYHGSWKLGIMHGKGTLKTQRSVYSGNFVNWLKHGPGEQYFNNGDTYRGEYQNGRFDGIGTYEWKNDNAFYEGNFKNGLRHGKGKWSKGETRYNGGYAEGLKEGYGELYFPSGNFYKGNFIQDKKEGYGEMFWTDSSFYKGEWKNGIQNGKGQIYMSGSDIVSGIFENGMLVQVMPSIYEKQMEISNLSIQDLFSNKKKIQNSTRTRTFSEAKNHHQRKKLAKIEESVSKNKKGKGTIQGNMYFKSPEKSDHSHGAQCKCAKRLENFRLKQQKGKKPTITNTSQIHSHPHRGHTHHDI